MLLPCRDASAHVDAALRSLASQSFDDFEVIAVDDGSTDDSGNRLDDWAVRDRRVCVLHLPPRGLVPALQTALGRSRGPLLARMDADDIAHPQRFAAQLELLAQRPDIAACGTRIRYVPRHQVRDGARRYQRWINGLTEPDAIARDIFVECPIPHPTLMIRRAALEAVGAWTESAGPEDYDLILRLYAAGFRMAKVPRILLLWREGPGRLSRTDPRYDADSFRRCKASHLAGTLLRGRDGTVVWGAGPVGKRFARALVAEGVRLRAFVDVDPRKIGQTICDAPVIVPADIHAFPDAFTVAAVSGARARGEIRAALTATGRIEMVDFCAVA